MPEITETKLKEQIAKEQIGSLYFLYGDEKLLVRRNLNRLLKKLDGNFPEFNFQEFPHDAPVDSIADAVVAMPFMAERKCVTVSDLNVEAMNTAETSAAGRRFSPSRPRKPRVNCVKIAMCMPEMAKMCEAPAFL